MSLKSLPLLNLLNNELNIKQIKGYIYSMCTRRSIGGLESLSISDIRKIVAPAHLSLLSTIYKFHKLEPVGRANS